MKVAWKNQYREVTNGIELEPEYEGKQKERKFRDSNCLVDSNGETPNRFLAEDLENIEKFEIQFTSFIA